MMRRSVIQNPRTSAVAICGLVALLLHQFGLLNIEQMATVNAIGLCVVGLIGGDGANTRKGDA
jgi:hypothetical protein